MGPQLPAMPQNTSVATPPHSYYLALTLADDLQPFETSHPAEGRVQHTVAEKVAQVNDHLKSVAMSRGQGVVEVV